MDDLWVCFMARIVVRSPFQALTSGTGSSWRYGSSTLDGRRCRFIEAHAVTHLWSPSLSSAGYVWAGLATRKPACSIYLMFYTSFCFGPGLSL
ncbi:hypothetical protein AG1IA_01908 [Rhizoctonia solani AG-1 IA]|uniref:Uncharacterized protein n=1 Tax=Thanatephorus cucumeris (strain AG1-IA) TaxID=983506 RepID=L8X4M6_THACA|nr:hypothetical protein AG1IA_01908 [Rhizoctonia solani AG-1 IA]